MIDIVIATHGSLSTGYLDAVELIMGNQKGIYTMSLKHGDGFDEFQKKMCSFLDKERDVLFLTDLLGASPYNAAAKTIGENRDKVIVCLTGINLGMVIEAVLKRKEMSIKNLSEYLVKIGKEGITSLTLDNSIELEG